MSKLPDNLKVRIKQLTHNSIVVLTISSSDALKPAQALANSLTAYARDHGIVHCNIVLTTPQVGVSVLDEDRMRALGWVKAPASELNSGQLPKISSCEESATYSPRVSKVNPPFPRATHSATA